ncbi:MAG: methionine adenosyltransferase [Candidatus Micrarchaeota archaeon]|nr:methionine adenosyltransferase [Candidatus Micrarchaeota archaeon]
MTRNIIIEKGSYIPAPKREVELVERKGLGHPDSIIDGMMEEISRELSKEYINQFGRILHHNVDKGQICGGATEVNFGGGIFKKPIYILLSGRATDKAEGKEIPVQHIAIKTAREYLKKAVRNLDVDSDVEIESRIAPGSADLVDVFLRGPRIPFANDTSFGTGYAPLDDLENVTLAIEMHLNSDPYKTAHPEVGEDIKIMGLREGNKLRISVAVAFIAKFVHNIEEYIGFKERIRKDTEDAAKKITTKEITVLVNTADDEKNESVYITATGTSAEMGDDGSVGRGNRVNGLITPYRSMTLEAAAGKNPVNHVGKIYNVLSFEIARQVVQEVPDVEDITVTLLSQIGKPIDQPKVASVEIITKDGHYDVIKSKVHYIVDKNLENITEATNKIVFGKVNVF